MSGNMGYCRFENTLRDLRDCSEALEDGLDLLSEDEDRAARKMILLCARIVKVHGHLVPKAKGQEGAGT